MANLPRKLFLVHDCGWLRRRAIRESEGRNGRLDAGARARQGRDRAGGKGGTLKEIEKTTVDGKTAYAASIVANGKEQMTLVGEDGKLISRWGAVEKDDDD
jgi:hypothetical protein